MKKIIALTLALMMLVSMTSYAKSVTTVIQDSADVVFDGAVEADGASKDITFWVLNKDVEWTNHEALSTSDVKYFDTKTLAGSEEGYSFTFQLTENGLYRVVQNHGADTAEAAKYIGYTKKADFDTAIDGLALCADASAVETYLSDPANKVKLAMYSDLFTIVTETEASEIVKASIDADSSFRDLTGAYLAQAYKQSEAISLNDYVADIADGKIEKHYNNSNEASYEAAVEGKTFANAEGFFAALEEAMILANVKSSNGASDITDMLNDYATELGLTKTVTDAISRTLMGNSYTKATLASAVNNYTGGNGGGGGGGGGSISDSHNPDVGITQGNDMSITAGGESGGNAGERVLFADLKSVDWAKEAIETLFAKGVVNGKKANLFYPLDSVLREECVAMLMRAFQFNITGTAPEFKDVVEGAWYKDVINTAYNAGVVKGESNEWFGIGQNVTRQDMAVMIYNALEVAEIELLATVNGASYTDRSAIADYAVAPVEYLQQRGIIKGYEDGSFGPGRTASRAELAVMLHRILPYLELGK